MKRNVISCAVSLFILVSCLTPTPATRAANSCEVKVLTDVNVPMRDSVELSTNIFLPETEGPFPVILTRTPYGKGDANNNDARFYASHGYVYVSQDCRGRGHSQGVWEPHRNEADDGHDTQKWIVQQSWCNGKIGTTGGSYVGFTQWITAPGAGDYLKCMFTVVPLMDCYSTEYIGGALNLALAMGWGSPMSYRPGNGIQTDAWNEKRWLRAFRTLPLCEWDKAINRRVQYLRDWVAHPIFDDYWATVSVRDKWDQVCVPAFAVSGWYDIFAKAVLEHTNAVRKLSKFEQVRRQQYVIMGPWSHGIGPATVGEVNFGPRAKIRLRELESRWFDYWLKGKDTKVEQWPALRIFVMGRNDWRDENEWPLKRTQFTPYYLHSSGSANTLTGDGHLDRAAPEDESLDHFIYDPNDPVPTLGGCNLTACPIGPHDQTPAEKRSDVLVYTSEPIEKELEVTGPVKVILYAASSAPDTDWTGKLVDVHPDGRAFNLCDGIIRARYRESEQKLSLIEPGKVYRYEIDLWVTSNVFLPGHKIRLEVSSSNFPHFDRNPNTGHKFGSDSELHTAAQTIYHDADHPSHILLPVIP